MVERGHYTSHAKIYAIKEFEQRALYIVAGRISPIISAAAGERYCADTMKSVVVYAFHAYVRMPCRPK